MSSLRRIAPTLLAMVCACAAQGSGGGPDEPVPYGLGGKADGGGCDDRAPLCWTSDDAAAMRTYFAGADALALGLGDPRPAAGALVGGLEALGHKLEPAEHDALLSLGDRLRALGPEAGDEERLALAAEAHARVAERLSTTYLAAHAVPLAASVGTGGGADAAPPELPIVVGDEGIAESLQILRDSGVFGYAYALMLEHTGVLDRDYPVLDEAFPFSEPREARVQRIVDHYAAASTRTSVLVNAEALIPYAGIPLSVAHGSYMQFRLRARMVMEVAAVYGVDIHEGHNLILVAGAIMGAMELSELRLLWGGTLALPLLARALRRLGRLVDPRAALRLLMGRAVSAIIRLVSRRGAEVAGRIATQVAVRGTSRQVLGYATFGLAILGDVLLTRRVTRRLGDHAGVMFRPWGAGMLLEGAPFLGSSATRECVARALGEAMWADGAVVESERALLAAHLSRRYWRDGGWVRLDGRAGMGNAAELAAGARPGAATPCLRDRLGGTQPDDRLTVLSWVLTMAAVDGAISTGELSLWEGMVDSLRGDAWFGDGDELRDEHVGAIHDRLEALARPESIVGAEAADLVRDLGPTDLIEGFDGADPEARRLVDCALDGC